MRRGRLRLAETCLLAALLAACGHAGTPPAHVFAGHVTDEEGAPIPGAAVYVFAPDEDGVLAETTTDEQGRFRFAVTSPGPVDVRAGRAVEVRADDDREFWHAQSAEALGVAPGEALRLVAATDARECTVRVRVTSADGRVAQVKVRAVPTMWPDRAAWWWPEDHTNAIGRADLDRLPRLPVELRVERTEPWCPMRGVVVLPDPLGVPLQRLVVERARVLEGRVVDARGAPVPACGVMVASRKGTPSRAWGDLTGEDGAFAVGVPESWAEATLLVGCAEPSEASAHRLALPVACAAGEVLEVRLPDAVAEGPAPAPGGDEETRRVVEAVLRAHYVGEGQPCLVLQRELGGLQHVRDVRTYLEEGVEDSTLADLARKAGADGVLPASLDVGVPTRVIAGAWWDHWGEVHGTLNRTLFRHLYARFPRSGGLVLLSPVAFSEDGAQAIVHVVNVRGRLNADGHWHLLEKRDGAWHVARRQMTWLS